MKTKKTTNTFKRPFNLLVMWFKFRKHPCYMGGGEFDHDWKYIDDSFDHEYGTHSAYHYECRTCGEDNDELIAEDYEGCDT